jgi:hypothetical protein
MPPSAASCRGNGSLMPNIFSGSGVNRLFGNIDGVIAHAFEATANENQIQVRIAAPFCDFRGCPKSAG